MIAAIPRVYHNQVRPHPRLDGKTSGKIAGSKIKLQQVENAHSGGDQGPSLCAAPLMKARWGVA